MLDTYKINTVIEVRFLSKAQVSGITDLTMVVTDPTETDGSLVTMTELVPGIYHANFTPNLIGVWNVRISSVSHPEDVFSKAYLVLNDFQYTYLDNDGTLSADSDTHVATQKAVKTYIDSDAVIASTATSTAESTASQALSLANADSSAASTASSKAVSAGVLASTAESTANTKSNLAPSPTAGDIATVDGSGNVTDSGKIFDTDGTLSADSDNRIATQKAVKTYADNLIVSNSAMIYKGTIDASSNPNYPAGSPGNVWIFSVGGLIGGGSGINVSAGDLLVCKVTNAGGTQASVGADFDTVQVNSYGVVIGPATSTDQGFALYNGTTGKLIQDQGLILSTDGTLSSNSDSKISSQKAVKTYADTKQQKFSITNVTATYLILSTDYTIHCTANTFNVTLPTAVGISGTVYNIKNSGTGTITVVTTSSQIIDNNLTVKLKQYSNLTIQSDGANWIIL